MRERSTRTLARSTRTLARSMRTLERSLTLATSLALIGNTSPAGAVPSFTELLRFGTGHPTVCVAWADYDLDGDVDLGVGNNGQNYLYRNDGGYVFTEQTAFGMRTTFALAWGDIDNDGDPDMAVGNIDSFFGNRLHTNSGNGTFSGQNMFGNGSTVALAWADYDLDGDLDLAVGKGIVGTIEQNYLYVNNGNGTWTEQEQFGIGQSCSVVWGDVDADGDPDLAVGRGGFGFVGQNVLYINNGNGTFTEREDFGLGDTSSLAFGDYDEDGDLDLAVANWDGGQSYLYVNDGAGNFTGQNQFGIGDPNTVAWGDFDNDGDLDVGQGNGDFTSGAPSSLWVNDGAGSFAVAAPFGTGSTDGVAWGDVDLDGDLDLGVGNEHSPNQNYLYVNQENDADFLFLRLVGHRHDLGAGYSNRDGVGAKVFAYEAGFLGNAAHLLGFREIEAHGGFSSQNQIDAHFGLPGRSTVDVRIVWPGSGGTHVTQDLPGVPVPGRFAVHEGITATAAPLATSEPLARWRVFPNPSGTAVNLELARSMLGSTELQVFDVTGQLVRRLVGVNEGGVTRARWDGTDAAGRSTGAGVYFVRGVGSTREVGRIVRLKAR